MANFHNGIKYDSATGKLFNPVYFSIYFCAHWGKSYILTKMNRDLLLID